LLSFFNRYKDLGYKTRLFNLGDEVWDRRLAVRTFGFHPAVGIEGDQGWRLHYEPTPYSDIFRLLRRVRLSKEDVFTDIGSGMGRAVFAASWMGARRSVGIEIVSNLCAKAIQNHRNSRLAGRDIEFVCANALDYHDWTSTVLFMFHPFGKDTLKLVLDDIFCERQKRKLPALRFIYLNPAYDGVLEEAGWLRCIGRVPASQPWLPTASHRYSASLWSTG
jgi:hypothetical protein